VFRGEQYVRAIGMWERKMGPGARPPNIDILVQQRFLRKKYKDPMTEDGEFQPIFLGANVQNPAGRGGQPPGRAGRGGSQPLTPVPPVSVGGAGPTSSGAGPGGGLYGVVSKSKETSIRLYKNRNHYNEWQFIYAGAGAAGGSATPGGRGGSPRPGLPGERGRGRGRGAGPGSRGGAPGAGFPPPTGSGPRGRGPGGT